MLCRCDTCTCLYAVGLAACPQCGATEWTLVDSGGQPVEAEAEPKAAEPDEPEPEPEPAAPVKAKAAKADA